MVQIPAVLRLENQDELMDAMPSTLHLSGGKDGGPIVLTYDPARAIWIGQCWHDKPGGIPEYAKRREVSDWVAP